MSSQGNTLSFVTLGTAILDEIRRPGVERATDILGGSGVFALFGARLFAEDPTQHGWIVKAGYDFPSESKKQILSWDTSTVFVDSPGPSSRGLLEYKDTTTKTFRYTTPLLRTEVADLANTPMLHAKSYHFFAAPPALVTQVQELLATRLAAGKSEPPFIVWEPTASSCTKDQVHEVIAAMAVVDCFSPNHIELASLLGLPGSFGPGVLEGLINAMAMQLVTQMRGAGARPPMILVRAAERGATLIPAGQQAEARPLRVPAYYTAEQNSSVVDTTGAGNAFLGAFTSTYAESLDLEEALCRGSIASSYALEQTGLPRMATQDGQESWNGSLPRERLAEFKELLSKR